MKKILALVMVILMVLTLGACSNKTEKNDTAVNTTTETPTEEPNAGTDLCRYFKSGNQCM